MRETIKGIIEEFQAYQSVASNEPSIILSTIKPLLWLLVPLVLVIVYFCLK